MKMSILTPAFNGTLNMATYLKKSGTDVKLLSTNFIYNRIGSKLYKENVDSIDQSIINFLKDSDCIGVSTVNPLKLLGKIKDELDIPFIHGGPETFEQISTSYQKIPEFQIYDYGIEGLPVDIPLLLELIEENKTTEKYLKNIRGLIYSSDGKLKFNKPYWHKSYYLNNAPDLSSMYFLNPVDKTITQEYSFDFISVPDSFGCPTGTCTFCTIKKTYLSFTPEEIVGMIEDSIGNNKMMNILLLSQSPSKIDKISKSIVERGVDIASLAISSRVDEFIYNVEKIEKALRYSRNFFDIHIHNLGFESFVQEDLDRLKKNVTVEQNYTAIKKLRELHEKHDNFIYQNPKSSHGLILFLPWTTVDSIKKNVDVLYENQLWDMLDPYVIFNKLYVRLLDNAMKDLDELSKQGKIKLKMSGGDDVHGDYKDSVNWEYKDIRMKEIEDLVGKLTYEFYNTLSSKYTSLIESVHYNCFPYSDPFYGIMVKESPEFSKDYSEQMIKELYNYLQNL